MFHNPDWSDSMEESHATAHEHAHTTTKRFAYPPSKEHRKAFKQLLAELCASGVLSPTSNETEVAVPVGNKYEESFDDDPVTMHHDGMVPPHGDLWMSRWSALMSIVKLSDSRKYLWMCVPSSPILPMYCWENDVFESRAAFKTRVALVNQQKIIQCY